MKDKELIAEIENNNEKLQNFINGDGSSVNETIALFEENRRLCKIANKLGVSIPGKSIMMMASVRIMEITGENAANIYSDIYGNNAKDGYTNGIVSGRRY